MIHFSVKVMTYEEISSTEFSNKAWNQIVGFENCHITNWAATVVLPLQIFGPSAVPEKEAKTRAGFLSFSALGLLRSRWPKLINGKKNREGLKPPSPFFFFASSKCLVCPIAKNHNECFLSVLYSSQHIRWKHQFWRHFDRNSRRILLLSEILTLEPKFWPYTTEQRSCRSPANKNH